jgi:aminoglycoside 3-N-acetyltransferase
MVTQSDMTNGLRDIGLNGGDNLFVHSSLSAFGWVNGGGDAVCDALLENVGASGTLVLPAFRPFPHPDSENVVFDVNRDPCNTGIVPETFRRRPGVLRSEHVCHSVAAFGPAAAEVMGDGVLPCGPGSSLHEMYLRNFWCVFLGCPFQTSCTAMHIVEEVSRVSYRYYHSFTGDVVRADGSRTPCRAKEFLLHRHIQFDFRRMEGLYSQVGVLRSAQVGPTRILALRLQDMVGYGLQFLRETPCLFISPTSRFWYRVYSRYGWPKKGVNL